MITKASEASKERLSLLDKKMLRDPKAHNISVLILRRVRSQTSFFFLFSSLGPKKGGKKHSYTHTHTHTDFWGPNCCVLRFANGCWKF